jgi:hypothetical protein
MNWKGKHNFLGIAVGERSIAVAEIAAARGDGGGTGWEMRRAAEFQPAGDIDGAGEEFKRFLQENGFNAARAVVGVPARWIVAREREVPPSSDAQAAEMLRLAAERMFSAELGELAVDYAGTADPSSPRAVLLMAMPRKQLGRIVQLVESAGREVAAVMPTTLALADAARPDGADNARDGLVLSLGGDAVELAAHRGGAPRLLRHLPVRGPELASQNGTRAAAVSSLAGEIRRTVAMMPRGGASASAATSADTLRVWDGVGLDAQDAVTLARQAGVELQGGAGAFSAMGLASGSQIAGAGRESAIRFAPALALALAGANPYPAAVDFLNPRLAPPKRQRFGRSSAWAIAIASAAAVGLLVLWGSVRWRESHAATLRASRQALDAQVASAEQISQRISIARGWYPQGRPAVLECLREITEAFPNDGEPMFVTQFSLPESRKGQLLGKSPNQPLVLDLVERLNKSPNFADAKHEYILRADNNSNDVAFSISFTYEGGGGVPAPAATAAPRR